MRKNSRSPSCVTKCTPRTCYSLLHWRISRSNQFIEATPEGCHIWGQRRLSLLPVYCCLHRALSPEGNIPSAFAEQVGPCWCNSFTGIRGHCEVYHQHCICCTSNNSGNQARSYIKFLPARLWQARPTTHGYAQRKHKAYPYIPLRGM